MKLFCKKDAKNFVLFQIFRQDLHIASLRARKIPMIETPEKLESLRQKQEEIQAQEREFKMEYEQKMEQIKYAQEQLDIREVKIIINLYKLF